MNSIAFFFFMVALSVAMPPNKKDPVEGDKFEGDIVFESGKTLAFLENTNSQYWPNGIVYYTYEPGRFSQFLFEQFVFFSDKILI